MSTCKCADATACEAIPPAITASKLVALTDANCQRALVPIPGSVAYTDGISIYFADGSSARPLSLPSMVNLTGADGVEVPALVFKAAGGVIGGLTAPAEDDLYIYSSGGQWTIGQLPVNTSWPIELIPEECCCPAAFAVLTRSDDDQNYELKRFNPCTDATTVTSGPILTCEDGCMRKLAGTDNDQVPVWDTGTSEWVPTDISELVPTPESSLDVANFYFEQTGDETALTPSSRLISTYNYGANGSYSINQSSTLISSVVSATPDYSHNAVRILNAGWHRVDFHASGRLIINSDLTQFSLGVGGARIIASYTGSPQSFEFWGNASVASSVDGGAFDSYLRYSISGSFAKNFTANSNITFQVGLSVLEGNGGTLPLISISDFTFVHSISGTVTRIT